MTMSFTLGALAVVAALVVLCGWMGARPLDLRRGPRMMPWRFLAALLLVPAIVLLVHLLGLLGLRTGA